MLKIVNAILLIVAAAIIVFYLLYKPADFETEIKSEGHIQKIIPVSPTGWTSEEQPLAQTEEVLRSTEKILRASQTFFRKYTSADGSRDFQVYVAYWGKGVENPRMAASHTPDRCWVLNGWKNDMQKLKFPYPIKVEGTDLMPANYRELSYDTGRSVISRRVVFWHIVDGKNYNYGQKSTLFESPYNYAKYTIENALLGAPEQYFVRIDSAMPLEDLWGDKGMQEILRALGKLILEEKTTNK